MLKTFINLCYVDNINNLKENGNHESADSLIRQAQNKTRNFTYYVSWSKYRYSLVPSRLSKKREYCINFNVEMNATNEQILMAYFFGLKLDEILQEKLNEKLTPALRKPSAKLTEEQHELRDR